MSTQTDVTPEATGVTEMTYREAITAALTDALAEDPTTLLMGEDVGAEGGVFKTNTGLIERFGPDRVRTTPICENGFVGVALGMSLVGLRPIVEIMFADFLPTAGDAIVNQLPKYRFMSGGQCHVPVTIRVIGGGTGRFGTQHSATFESWFMHLPGLRVASASSPGSAYSLLRAAIADDNPVVFFEHKALYGRKGPVDRGEVAPIGKAAVVRSGNDVTIVATMLMVGRALAAADVARGGGDRGRGHRPALAAPTRRPDGRRHRSRGPAGWSSSRSRSTRPVGARRSSRSSPSAARSGPRRHDASACPTTTRSRTRRRSRTRSSRRSTASSLPRGPPRAADRLAQSEAVPPPPDPPRSRAM